MANYIVTPCSGGPAIPVNDGGYSFNIGNTYFLTFIGGTVAGCYEITSLTGPITVDTIYFDISLAGGFADCLQCENMVIQISDCQDGTVYNITLSSFFAGGSLPPIPFGSGFNFTLGDPSESKCYAHVGYLVVEEPGIIAPTQTIQQYYAGGCDECQAETPYEVNPPEYELCVKDCDGNTVVLSLPHPVYTNEYGTAVTQLNAVELGGVNGLNN